jgi:hypothetical protein
MKITITDAKRTPSWETLQTVVREVTGSEYGKFIRIARPDGKCDYGAPGVYNVSFRTDGWDIIEIELTVE